MGKLLPFGVFWGLGLSFCFFQLSCFWSIWKKLKEPCHIIKNNKTMNKLYHANSLKDLSRSSFSKYLLVFVSEEVSQRSSVASTNSQVCISSSEDAIHLPLYFLTWPFLFIFHSKLLFGTFPCSYPVRFLWSLVWILMLSRFACPKPALPMPSLAGFPSTLPNDYERKHLNTFSKVEVFNQYPNKHQAKTSCKINNRK